MFDHHALDAHAGSLSTALADKAPTPQNPLPADTWIARSVLQKAIRRGMSSLAIRAAATLFATDRRVLWRRLLITCLEDLGPASFDTTAKVVAAMVQTKFRADLAREWSTVSLLVTLACDGLRDQSANDLANIARNAPELADFRSSLCELDAHEIFEIAGDPGRPADERAAVSLIAIGEGCGPDSPRLVQPDPTGLFSVLETGEGSAEILWHAYRLTRIGLAPLNLLLCPSVPRRQAIAGVDDDLPPVAWIGDVPSFALDQYTRGGRRALASYVQTSRGWKKFAGDTGLPPRDWSDAAGELLFRGEGALVTRRASYPQADSLFRRSATLGCFMPESAVAEGIEIIRSELPLIDQIRPRHQPT